MTRPLLILDLDETLVFSTEAEPARGFDFKLFVYFVTKRPHLDEFLARVPDWFDLAVWSSSDDAYAKAMAARLFPGAEALRFVWGRTRCTPRYDGESLGSHYLKDLKKVRRRGHDLRRVLILDDSPEKVSRNYGNHVRIGPFEGDPGDRELLDVLPFLEWLKDQPDFRAVEKRTWRVARA